MLSNIIHFIRNNWSLIRKALLWLILCILLWVGYINVRKIINKSLILAEPSEIVVIRPTESQEVIIIGDPEKVNVNNKRNNRK